MKKKLALKKQTLIELSGVAQSGAGTLTFCVPTTFLTAGCSACPSAPYASCATKIAYCETAWYTGPIETD